MAGRFQRLRQFLRNLAIHGSMAVLATGTTFLPFAAADSGAAPPVQLGAPELNTPATEVPGTADQWQPGRSNGTYRADAGPRIVSLHGAPGTNSGAVRVIGTSQGAVKWHIRDNQASASQLSPSAAPRTFAAPENARAIRSLPSTGHAIRPVSGETEFRPENHPQHDPFGDRAPVSGAVLNAPNLNPPAAEGQYSESGEQVDSRAYSPGIRVASQPPSELPQLPPEAPSLGPPLRPLPANPPRTVDETEPARPTTEQPRDQVPEQAPEQTTEPPADPVEQTPPARRPLAAPRTGSTPGMESRRNTEFCQQTYNERNCCSDGNECQAHRERVRSHPISKISLDITPTCNLSTRRGGEQTKCGFPFEDAPSRVWRDRNGETLAEGRVTAMANLRLDITSDEGKTVRIRVRDLGEDDICFLAAWCGVPSECRLDDVALVARDWTPLTMTWKASGLCHRPLYFEEVQLERYGHTAGPFAQPILSGAHFFANIAVLPYKMGIHPMNECQYSLGYYRPGNCAPWLVPPIPLSVRGAAAETAAVLGGIFIFP